MSLQELAGFSVVPINDAGFVTVVVEISGVVVFSGGSIVIHEAGDGDSIGLIVSMPR